MKEYEYDVLVVGGGPGGAMAAREAAKRGKDVLIVEKRPEIGTLVRCGEGLAKGLLDWTGIEPSNRFIDNEVDGARIFAPDERYNITVDQKQAGSETGYIIDRSRFDKHLITLAVSEGAELWVKSPAVALVMDNGKTFGLPHYGYSQNDGTGKAVGAIVRHYDEGLVKIKAKVIIGADGVESHVARWAGINVQMAPNDVISGVQYRMVNIDGDHRWTDFYIGQKIAPGGYIWVFPKSDTEANVGIGLMMSYCKDIATAKRYLDLWIEKHPGIKKGSTVQITTGAVPVAQPPDSVVTDNVMLVGDAARMADPLTGGGIANAMYAGIHAGRVAADAIDAGDTSKEFFQRYEEAWREKFEDKMYRNWMAKEKFAKMDDDMLNKIIDAISTVPMDEISTYTILKAVEEKYPELLEDLADFL